MKCRNSDEYLGIVVYNFTVNQEEETYANAEMPCIQINGKGKLLCFIDAYYILD
jgi:hypothetical protein